MTNRAEAVYLSLLALLACWLPVLSATPCAPCTIRPGACTEPPCSNDATTVGDECVTWNAAAPGTPPAGRPAPTITGYHVRSATSIGPPCCVVPASQLSAVVAESGCLQAASPAPDGSLRIAGMVVVYAEQSDGQTSAHPSNAVTFDAPVVCFGHYNCRTALDAGVVQWVCDGCERRCSNLAPLYTTLPVCL